MSAVSVAQFRTEQADALVRMWRKSAELGIGISGPHSIEEQIEYLLTEVAPVFLGRVAWLDLEIAGFLASNSEVLSQLYVNVSHLGRGVGSLLLNTAKEDSAGSLCLETFTRNRTACRFFERHGFAIVDRGLMLFEKGFNPPLTLATTKYKWSRDSSLV